jgi:hypothetical protein
MQKKSILKIGGILAAGVLIGKLIALLINSPAIQTRMLVMNAPREIREYIRTHPIRKLQLGAGGLDYPGWLNTDITPGPQGVYLDATRPFPIPDGSINYIFGEHVIEHLTYGEVADVLDVLHNDAALKDYRWCRNELVAIHHQLSSPIPVVEETKH